jgi:hypothetical protein
MIFQSSLVCRGFTLCYGSYVPNETMSHPNTGNGIANQAAYLYFGNVTASQNGTNIEMLAGQVNDLSSFIDAPTEFKAGDSGAAWLAINPTPSTKKYDITVAPIGNSVVTSSSSECVILCVDGSIDCNGKVVNKMQYTRVRNSTSVNLNIPDNSVALIMTA